MITRDALEADLPAIVEIYNQAIRGRISTAQLEEVSVQERRLWFHAHSAKTHPLWVAEIDGQIAGWFSFHPFIKRAAYRGTAEISVYVGEKSRRRGVGKALLEQAVARSPNLQLSALVGYIFEVNEASVRLFERMGFERWGLLPRVALVDGVERSVAIMGRQVP
ncbi:MAG TPA: GNAT family N-acetyltransferase [Chthoniobacterales bacterium]|nr:GNAT family N-acetyltransferase [Chthoniobacterales bacterium]